MHCERILKVLKLITCLKQPKMEYKQRTFDYNVLEWNSNIDSFDVQYQRKQKKILYIFNLHYLNRWKLVMLQRNFSQVNKLRLFAFHALQLKRAGHQVGPLGINFTLCSITPHFSVPYYLNITEKLLRSVVCPKRLTWKCCDDITQNKHASMSKHLGFF